MNPSSPERTQLTIRAPSNLQKRLAKAAACRGLSLNSFILQAATREADSILEQERVLRLTEADLSLILNLLDSPPEPNGALKRAFARRQKLLGDRR